jgi:hypothetical protein
VPCCTASRYCSRACQQSITNGWTRRYG